MARSRFAAFKENPKLTAQQLSEEIAGQLEPQAISLDPKSGYARLWGVFSSFCPHCQGKSHSCAWLCFCSEAKHRFLDEQKIVSVRKETSVLLMNRGLFLFRRDAQFSD